MSLSRADKAVLSIVHNHPTTLDRLDCTARCFGAAGAHALRCMQEGVSEGLVTPDPRGKLLLTEAGYTRAVQLLRAEMQRRREHLYDRMQRDMALALSRTAGHT